MWKSENVCRHYLRLSRLSKLESLYMRTDLNAPMIAVANRTPNDFSCPGA